MIAFVISRAGFPGAAVASRTILSDPFTFVSRIVRTYEATAVEQYALSPMLSWVLRLGVCSPGRDREIVVYRYDGSPLLLT